VGAFPILGTVQTHTKRNPSAPPDFFACEAAGLQWLSDAGGAACVQVVAYDATSLTLRRLQSVTPSAEAAREFGAALATMHDAGADGWGAPPRGWRGPGYFGPLSHPLPMTFADHDTWGRFYADERLMPMLDLARPGLSPAAIADLEEVIGRCRAGEFDDDDVPARLHGDLWGGNLMWTADGVVLIDPAAHGGHRETDIAMLHLFGCPHLDAVISGYEQRHPLKPGWRQRIPLHQLYPLLAHVVLFGAAYVSETHQAARRVLAASGSR
jgi:fructosamine-3-kinase